MHTPKLSPDAPFPDAVANTDPQRAAFVLAGTGHVVTYGELVDSSRAIAALLWSRGLRHGDCLAILMENTADYLPVAWAAQRCGLRYVGLPTRLEPADVAYILRDCHARALVTSATCLERAAAALQEAPGVELRLTTGPAAEGFEELAEAVASAPPSVPEEREGVDLLYSSGTTGRPKGVASDLPLAPLGTPPGVATLLHDRWGLDEETVYLSPAPLYHAAPLRFCMTVQRYGGTVVIMDRFDAEAALELVERYRVTHTQMVPTMLIRILKLPEQVRQQRDLSSLQVLVHAAAPCPPETKRATIEWLGPIVHEYYSSTENYLFTAINSEEWLEHPGSVGRALAGRPHILDEDGHELPAGEIGTIWSEGGLSFEYLNDPAKTAEARNELGWTTVGDLGHLDEDGYLYLADRRADLVLSGGVNIYPQEAENALVEHPDVADAAVFGIPHDELGEVVHAVVQLRPGCAPSPELAAQLIDWCRQRLSTFKCPRDLDFADQLPRTATGKLLKRELKDSYR
ncbi:AMP-binding protein [Prauserella rugosa]|uniref:AMP-binding protein n=1 Tax=Prauserella rugosa TaxID=43354 RepID=UPI000689E5E4|nr:AMP-binding protein [Prauserella rugosa]